MTAASLLAALAALGAAPTPAAPPALTVRGVVRRADSHQAIAGATVQAGGARATTDAAGAFALTTASAERLAVFGDGFLPLEQRLPALSGGELSLQLALISTKTPGTIRGTVRARVAGDGGKLVPAATARLEADSRVFELAADGTFVITGAGPGPVSLVARGKGYRPAEEIVAVPPAGEATIELILELAAEPPQVAMRGQIRSIRGGPVAATIRILERKIDLQADAAGKFDLKLPAGQYTARIEAPGFITQTKKFSVDAGDQLLLYVDLSPSERR